MIQMKADKLSEQIPYVMYMQAEYHLAYTNFLHHQFYMLYPLNKSTSGYFFVKISISARNCGSYTSSSLAIMRNSVSHIFTSRFQ